jgi:hypothetical protein
MQEPYYATTDTKIASCLCTVGVPLRQQDPISRVIHKGKETVHYWFKCEGASGVATGSIVQAIIEGQEACEALRDQLPDLPGARAALYNRELLLDVIFKKTRQLVLVNLPQGGVMLADKNLDATTKRDLAQLIM